LKTGNGYKRFLSPRTKKADVAEHPKVFGHVGLLFNEPPGQSRVALHMVIRPIVIILPRVKKATVLTATPHWLNHRQFQNQ
jgi:hypothetical protein